MQITFNENINPYLNAREYRSWCQSVRPYIVWLEQVERLAVPNWQFPMKMDMQSFQGGRLTLAVCISWSKIKENIHFKLERHLLVTMFLNGIEK